MTRRLAVACAAAIIAVATFAATRIATADVSAINGPAECCAEADRVNPPTTTTTTTTTVPAPRRANHIGLIGDSLTVGMTVDAYQFGPTIQGLVQSQGRAMWVTNTVSMTMAQGHEALAAYPSGVRDAEVIVVALGTNDVVGYQPGVWRDRIDQIRFQVAAIDPSTHVVWVDLSFPRRASNAAEFNAILDQVAASDNRFHRCRWADQIAQNPQWYGGDNLHLTGTGYAARRDIVIACIDAVPIPA